MLERVPLVGGLLSAGADDRVFDVLLAAGPAVIGAIALFGRNAVTTALAAGYVLAFFGYTAAKGLVGYRRQ
ncbi:MAG: hypothetical protein ABEJ68_07820 [Halobacteriaceae archaeon]